MSFLDDRKTTHLKKWLSIFNKYICLSDGTSNNKSKGIHHALIEFLCPHLSDVEQQAQRELLDEMLVGIYLLANRVDEKTMESGHDAKRYSREASTCPNIYKGGRRDAREGLELEREQRVEDMEREGILEINDTSQVELLVLLDHKIEMLKQESNLIGRSFNAVRG